MRSLPVLAVLLCVAPSAAAQVQETALPAALTQPLAVEFDAQGDLWMTLDGTWALARMNTSTAQFDVVKLASPKADKTDSLWGLRFAPDGSVWTGSMTHLHRIDPVTLQATSHKLPTQTILTGDLTFTSAGQVWFALVSADRIVRFDPATGEFETITPPVVPFGPISFDRNPSGLFVAGTYADTYARFDDATGAMELGPSNLLSGPVGMAHAGGALWIGEMGSDNVARVDPATGDREHFPTTPSPFYQVSGPSGILVARSGIVWFAEHFADRIARLDPERRTLHEFQVPSAPGTNVQRVAEAPDGNIWFAEWSKNRIGHVSPSVPDPDLRVADRFEMGAGKSARLAVETTGEIVTGTSDANVTARVEGLAVVLETSAQAKGSYNVLVSIRDGVHTQGRYVEVVVTGGKSPMPEAAGLLFVVAFAALAIRRRTF